MKGLGLRVVLVAFGMVSDCLRDGRVALSRILYSWALLGMGFVPRTELEKYSYWALVVWSKAFCVFDRGMLKRCPQSMITFFNILPRCLRVDLLHCTSAIRHEPIPIWLLSVHRPFRTLLFPSPSPHERLAHFLSFSE